MAALVLFVAVACIYCAPALEGKVIQSGDSTSAAAAVHESTEYSKNTGDYTFWTGSMFSGMPNYQIGGGHYEACFICRKRNGIHHERIGKARSDRVFR